MDYAVTHGVRISVESFYQAHISHPLDAEFVFAYRIRIDNGSANPFKLLRRYWNILDSTGHRREVEGEGVLGIQPEVPSGGSHEYSSWCKLRTELGKMSGYFTIRDLQSGELINVLVPEFHLLAPLKLN